MAETKKQQELQLISQSEKLAEEMVGLSNRITDHAEFEPQHREKILASASVVQQHARLISTAAKCTEVELPASIAQDQAQDSLFISSGDEGVEDEEEEEEEEDDDLFRETAKPRRKPMPKPSHKPTAKSAVKRNLKPDPKPVPRSSSHYPGFPDIADQAWVSDQMRSSYPAAYTNAMGTLVQSDEPARQETCKNVMRMLYEIGASPSVVSLKEAISAARHRTVPRIDYNESSLGQIVGNLEALSGSNELIGCLTSLHQLRLYELANEMAETSMMKQAYPSLMNGRPAYQAAVKRLRLHKTRGSKFAELVSRKYGRGFMLLLGHHRATFYQLCNPELHLLVRLLDEYRPALPAVCELVTECWRVLLDQEPALHFNFEGTAAETLLGLKMDSPELSDALRITPSNM